MNSKRLRISGRRCGDIATIALILATLAAGCSGGEEILERAAVNGTVTLDGEPLAEGIIRFVPVAPTKGPKVSIPIEQGQFASDDDSGPIVGAHRVEIQSTDDGGFAFDDEQAMNRLQASGTRRIDVIRVPPAYNLNSTLTASVSAEQPNEFTFDLTTNPTHIR